MRKLSKNIGEEILVQLSKKYQLPLSVIQVIAYTPFRKLKQLQREGSFETMFLPNFGKFLVKEGMRTRIEQLRELKKAQLIAREINKKQQLDL